jgi:integrase
MPAGRRPNVNYWTSRGTWIDAEGNARRGAYCTTLNGTQHVLAAGPDDAPKGPTYNAALTAFRDLLALDNAGQAKDNNTCRVVLEHWLRDLVLTAKPTTIRLRKEDGAAFCKSEMGDWPVNKLTPFAVQNWLRTMREPRTVTRKLPNGKEWQRSCRWGEARIRRVLTALHAAFNWAERTRLISRNPIKGLQVPRSRSRARDCLVAPQDHKRILGRARPQLRHFIICLENTGCRPGELLMATAKDWHDDLGALVFYADSRRQEGEARHKNSAKEKDRRIFFSGGRAARGATARPRSRRSCPRSAPAPRRTGAARRG